MHIFRRPDYRSDATVFIDELKTKRPDLVEQQAVGRALLWDKIVDRAAWMGFRKARVEQKPYVYQTDIK